MDEMSVKVQVPDSALKGPTSCIPTRRSQPNPRLGDSSTGVNATFPFHVWVRNPARAEFRSWSRSALCEGSGRA